MKASEDPIVVSQRFEAPVETVWKAITDLDWMTRWYFENIPAFEPAVGFATEFVVVSSGRRFPHRWRVTEVVAEAKISYDWTYENYPGRGLVTFALEPRAGGTLLTLSNDVLEDFPDDVPELRRSSCQAGWEYFIQQRLAEFLESESAGS